MADVEKNPPDSSTCFLSPAILAGGAHFVTADAHGDQHVEHRDQNEDENAERTTPHICTHEKAISESTTSSYITSCHCSSRI
ncbi:MAG: hypothetical protein C3F11_15205 [Methylocystaceae bacterium]|nr:MAG: hypothetical protein C3F11_15205 [Methylocystaceae bacterium]